MPPKPGNQKAVQLADCSLGWGELVLPGQCLLPGEHHSRSSPLVLSPSLPYFQHLLPHPHHLALLFPNVSSHSLFQASCPMSQWCLCTYPLELIHYSDFGMPTSLTIICIVSIDSPWLLQGPAKAGSAWPPQLCPGVITWPLPRASLPWPRRPKLNHWEWPHQDSPKALDSQSPQELLARLSLHWITFSHGMCFQASSPNLPGFS